MAADADIFPPNISPACHWVGSLALHAALFALALFSYLIPSGRGENWGGTQGGGGAMSATLVNSIPLPNAQPEAQNVLANESKGLSQSPPKEAPKEEPNAIPIPAQDAKPKGQHESASAQKRACQSRSRKPNPTTKSHMDKAAQSAARMARSPRARPRAASAFKAARAISAAVSLTTWTSCAARYQRTGCNTKSILALPTLVAFTFISKSIAPANRPTFASSSPAESRRSINRRCALCNALIPSALCLRDIRATMLP